MGRAYLVNNISRISLSSVETEILSLRLKFATGIRNHNIGKLINTNHRHHDCDLNKGCTGSMIATSTYCHFDDLALPNKYITALKCLSSNHNIVISSCDKDRGVVIMDSTIYNQKSTDLLDDKNTYEHISLQTVLFNINKFKKSYKNNIY